jgi:hypothetical protein
VPEGEEAAVGIGGSMRVILHVSCIVKADLYEGAKD